VEGGLLDRPIFLQRCLEKRDVVGVFGNVRREKSDRWRFERDDRSASAALVARSPRIMEVPALWRRRTVAAPMPFAPPKVGVSALKIEGGNEGIASGGPRYWRGAFVLARKRSTYLSRRQPSPSIC
jgi:hypothetical protein